MRSLDQLYSAALVAAVRLHDRCAEWAAATGGALAGAGAGAGSSSSAAPFAGSSGTSVSSGASAGGAGGWSAAELVARGALKPPGRAAG